MKQKQYLRSWGTLLGLCLCLAFGLQANDAVLPAWLEQVKQQKAQQPEQMLVLLQQHQAAYGEWDNELQVQFLLQLSDVYESLGKHQQQYEVAERGLALLGDRRDLTTIEFWNNLGFAHEMQSQYQQALHYYLQASALAAQLKADKLHIEADINIAAIYSIQDKTQEALALLKSCYDRAVLLNDPESLAYVNAELGLLYVGLGFDKEAIQFMENALIGYEALGWQKDKMDVLFNLARSYSYTEQYDKAMLRYDQLLQLAIAQQDHANLYFAYLGLASTSKDNGKLDVALAYIAKAEQYLPDLQSTYQNSMHHYEKALIYRELGQISLASQQLAQAEQSLNKEENNANQSSVLWILNLKARLEADSGRYQKAYEHLDQFFKGYHKLRNKEHELSVEKLRLGFDTERQQAQNELLAKDNELQALRLQEAERKRQIQWLWIGLFGCTSLVLLVLLLWQLARRQAQLQAQAQAQLQAKSLEKQQNQAG
ncbi:tetratricopeptide repeat protein [Rheinheimera soli]|uniref:Tetratricopeptide (TPR) repeat protein n=1 Tax=Rheinheimera soli TaxID=443616 RepID=A0ABU1VXF0_9GAMM|nr:tetratricopeptide repeat protein [Rheinheimera soli]MDR7120123.1 tetratricopeptide (TPR) repeat protein [Rheinheimera soli]